MLASIVENAGLVTVIATPQDDTVVISSATAGFTDISINAGQAGAQFARFTTSQIDKVLVWAGAGNDSVYSTARVPTEVNGQAGNDVLQGGFVDDIVRGGGGENRLYGKAGNDTLVGGPAIDRIFGANGNDSIFGNGGNDYLAGHGGNDTISGGTGNDNIQAGAGNDTIYGGNGNDNIAGHAGNDVMYGNEGNDSINGGDGNDLVAGQAGNDTLNGSSGNDIINGSFGDDLLLGFGGDDTLDGGEGVDRLFGGDGEDFLEGGFDTGADRLNGGAQNDTFVKRDGDILEDEDANGLDSVLDYTSGGGDDDGGITLPPGVLLPAIQIDKFEDFNSPAAVLKAPTGSVGQQAPGTTGTIVSGPGSVPPIPSGKSHIFTTDNTVPNDGSLISADFSPFGFNVQVTEGIDEWGDIINPLGNELNGTVGSVVLSGHGFGGGVATSNGALDVFTISESAKVIISTRLSADGVVIIGGCTSAFAAIDRDRNGKHDLQDLANELGKPVLGNTSTVGGGLNGTGDWVRFDPGN